MKNINKIAFVAVSIMLTAHANAQDLPPSAGIETSNYLAKFHVNEGTFKLRIYVGKQEGNENILQVSLKDKDGNPLYFKKMDKNQRQATIDFDLDSLGDGTYTFELSDKNGKTTKTFYKETDAILVKVNKQLVALK